MNAAHDVLEQNAWSYRECHLTQSCLIEKIHYDVIFCDVLDEKYDCDAADIDTSLDFTLQMQKPG